MSDSWFIIKPRDYRTLIRPEAIAKVEAGEYSWKVFTETEKLYETYLGKWIPFKDDDIDHEAEVEHFYLNLLPRCAEEFPEFDLDTMRRDFGIVNHQYNIKGINRYFTAAYTPHGIMGIDSYFCKRIQNMLTLEEGLEIEAQLIYCPHLHIKYKENLIDNLNNYMLALG